MVYQWKEGARIGIDPQIAGTVCAALEAQNQLTAKKLLDVSRPEDAPLHGAFEWKDETAAEYWRQHQARHIINSLVMSVESTSVEEVRCFFKTQSSEPNYRSLPMILKDRNETRELLNSALRELEAIRKKYSAIDELQRVFTEIERVQKEQVS